MEYWKSMFDYNIGRTLKISMQSAKFSRGFPEEVYVTLPENVKLCKLQHRYPGTKIWMKWSTKLGPS
ncbi:hypothetical protein RCL_jg11532.t1 [Rhizophagus clarus]|uniref:Uncharacterized protein n=1 Tax=Rhizophagus clarus TaxID=94130 RepID=A0A8H3LA98_9GLOM|nr:hypothetical protein RCL_jg11532.t1 [Rhizophagus clarus]